MSDDVDPGMINMAHIRVAGVGGLGLVALAIIVASQYQMISGTLTIGAIGGLAGAAAVILWRRRHGPLGVAGDKPGGRRFLGDGSRSRQQDPSP